MLMQADSTDLSSVHMNGSQDDSLEGSSEASAVCVCGSPCDDDRNCVQCDRCEDYFHPECIGYSPEQVAEQSAFFCNDCNQELFKASPSAPSNSGSHNSSQDMPFASMSAMSASIRKRLAMNAIVTAAAAAAAAQQQQQQQQLPEQDSTGFGAGVSPERVIPPGIDSSLAAELPDSDMDALISLSMLASGRSPSVHDIPANRDAPPSPSFSEGAMARFRLLSVVSPSPHSPVPTSAGNAAAAYLSPTSPLDSGSSSSISLSRSIPRTRSTRSHSFSNTMSTPKTPSIAAPGTPTMSSSGRKKTVVTKPTSVKRTPRAASRTPTRLMASITLGSSAPTMGFSPADGAAMSGEGSVSHVGSWSAADHDQPALSSSVPTITVSPQFPSQTQSAPSSTGRESRSVQRAPNSAPSRQNDRSYDEDSHEEGDHKRVFHNERERQRRSTIRNLFEELRRNVPTVAPQEGTSDRQILMEAAQHIDQLDSEGKRLETMLMNLRIENLKLRLSTLPPNAPEAEKLQEQLSSLMSGSADPSFKSSVPPPFSPVKKPKGGAKRQGSSTPSGKHPSKPSPLHQLGPQSELLTLLQVAEEEWGHLPHDFGNLSSSAPS